jgi:hypothetical protein
VHEGWHVLVFSGYKVLREWLCQHGHLSSQNHTFAATTPMLRCGERVHELEDMHDVIIAWPDRAAT